MNIVLGFALALGGGHAATRVLHKRYQDKLMSVEFDDGDNQTHVESLSDHVQDVPRSQNLLDIDVIRDDYKDAQVFDEWDASRIEKFIGARFKESTVYGEQQKNYVYEFDSRYGSSNTNFFQPGGDQTLPPYTNRALKEPRYHDKF